MRAPKKRIFVGLLIAVVAVIDQASAATQVASSVHCSWKVVAQGRSYHYEGTWLGSVKCSRSFGTGRFYGKYEAALTPPTASETSRAKLSFKRGTVRGTYHLSGIYSGNAHNYHGTFDITAGTGQFKHVAGTLQLACTVRVPTEVCDASGKLTGI